MANDLATPEDEVFIDDGERLVTRSSVKTIHKNNIDQILFEIVYKQFHGHHVTQSLFKKHVKADLDIVVDNFQMKSSAEFYDSLNKNPDNSLERESSLSLSLSSLGLYKPHRWPGQLGQQ